jgi:hypothetical protein
MSKRGKSKLQGRAFARTTALQLTSLDKRSVKASQLVISSEYSSHNAWESAAAQRFIEERNIRDNRQNYKGILMAPASINFKE